MSWSKGNQPSGWTAFDLKQKNKNSFESEVDKDPFPPIGSSGSMRHGDKFIKKKHVPPKPFSSVLLPNKNFPPLKEVGNGQKAVSGYDSDGKSFGTAAQEDANLHTKKLKEQHPWAENSLIEDILAAVNNNVDKAVALLETMASAVNFDERKISSDPRPTISETGESLASEMVKDDILFHSNFVGHLQ
ncbi:smr protein/MutS2 C-terminal, partial [Trifolium medium]|nr:smr protein/MutS2 C-terminal [Trifolium medium]